MIQNALRITNKKGCTMHALTSSRSAGARFAPSFSALIRNIVAARALARQRKALAKLDDHLLCDIGLTRSEAENESRRPAWDAPRHWF